MVEVRTFAPELFIDVFHIRERLQLDVSDCLYNLSCGVNCLVRSEELGVIEAVRLYDLLRNLFEGGEFIFKLEVIELGKVNDTISQISGLFSYSFNGSDILEVTIIIWKRCREDGFDFILKLALVLAAGRRDD